MVPRLVQEFATLVELIGGFAVLVGAFRPIVSLPMAVVHPSALRLLHREARRGYRKRDEVRPVGYEVILLYRASLAALVLGGAGPASIDQWRYSRRVRS